MRMSCMMRLNHSQDKSLDSNCTMVSFWKSLFCGMHCFMISMFDVVFHSNHGYKRKITLNHSS